MTNMERLTKLYELGEQDSIYCGFKGDYEDNRKAFRAFATAQDEQTRNFLFAYAESGRLMLQRLCFLACTCMEFPEEKDQGAP